MNIVRRAAYVVAQVVTVVLLIWWWEHAVRTGRISEFFGGRPTKIWATLKDWAGDGTLLKHTWETTKILLIGFMLGTGIGAVIGCFIGLSETARLVLEPYLIFMNAIPRLILFPFFVVWLGFGQAPKIITVVVVVLTAVVINVSTGIREVQGAYLDNMRVLGARRRDLFNQIYVPSLALWLISTSQVTMTYAFTATIVTQFVGANEGLGYLVNLGRQTLDSNMVYASIGIILIMSIIIYAILGLLEKRVTRWMPARR